MRTQRWPSTEEIAYIVEIIKRYIPVTVLRVTPRVSDRGTPNVRISNSSSDKIFWMVDVYSETYFCVSVQGHPPEICTDMVNLVNYLSLTAKGK